MRMGDPYHAYFSLGNQSVNTEAKELGYGERLNALEYKIDELTKTLDRLETAINWLVERSEELANFS